MQMILKFQPCPQSAEKYVLRLILLKFHFYIIFGLLAGLGLQDLGALVTDTTPALNFLTRLQTDGKMAWM